MDDDRLLLVPVVSLAFFPDQAANETQLTAGSLDRNAKAWAVAQTPDADVFRRNWRDRGDAALLIVHSPPGRQIDLACELLRLLPEGPVALLLANLPPQPGLFKSRRFGDEVVRRLQQSRHDLQVHVYSLDWSRRPPRLR